MPIHHHRPRQLQGRPEARRVLRPRALDNFERLHRGQEAGAKPWAEFENFPHYSTLGQLRLSSAEANLLAELTTWVVLQHAEEITAALSGHRDQ